MTNFLRLFFQESSGLFATFIRFTALLTAGGGGAGTEGGEEGGGAQMVET